ncbi:MAG: tape measure protein [Oceanisphaera sp.]|uniref:tape measure protein n=1 Tax=Oceanisphaera sp. TaxID=1929979 RepID=UPI003C71FA3E
MALKDKVVNLVIRGKNLFSGTAAEAEESLESLGSRTRELKAELDKLENTQKIVKGFGDQKRAVTEAEKSYHDGTKAVADMARELRASEGAGKGLNRQWEAAKTAVSASTTAMQQQRQAIKESSTAQSQAERELKSLNAEYQKGSMGADEYARALDKAETQLDEAKRAHDANKRSLAQSSQANKEAGAEVRRLGSAVKQNQRDTRGLATQFDRAKTAAAGAKTEFQRQREALERSRRAINEAGGSTRQLSETQRRLTEQQKRLRAAMDEARGAAAKKAASIKKLGNDSANTENKLGRLTRTVLASIAAFLGFRAVGRQLAEMFKTGDKFERLESQVTALMGSIEGGQEATAWIKEFAKDTPLQLEEVTSIFVKLKAFGLDPMNGSMQSVVDQAYKLGGSFQEVEGVALALGQAWAKQKLQGEEILQLIERGVPVWDLLAKVTGKNTGELQKMVSAGELGRDTIQALMDEMGAQSTGAAAVGMSQLSGLISNAKDNIADFYNSVADAGILNWLKDQLAAVNAEFRSLSDGGQLKTLAQNISGVLVAMGESVKNMVVAVYDSREVIVTFAKEWLVVIKGVLEASIKIIKSLATTIYEWRAAVVAVGGAWAALKILSMIRDVKVLVIALGTGLVAALRSVAAYIVTATAAAGRLRIALMLIPGVGWGAAIITALGAVAYGGYKAAVSISGLNREIEAGSKAEAKQRKFWRETLRQNEAIVTSLREYRDMQILTAEQVAHLSKAEQAAYKKKLALHKEYLAAQLYIKKSHEQLGLAALSAHIEVEESIKRVNQAQKDFADGIKIVVKQVNSELNPAISAMVKQFDNAALSGGKADAHLRSLFKDLDITAKDDVGLLIDSLMELKKTSRITGEDINHYLGGSLRQLSTVELAQFEANTRSAFAAVSGGAAESARVVEQITGEAYRRLGLSMQEVQTGIGEADEQILGSFKLISSNAKTTAAELSTAFLASVGRITSEKGLAQLQTIWRQITEEGRISTETSGQHLDTLGKKMVETKLKAAGIGTGFAQSKDGVQELIDTLYKMADTGEFTAEQIQQYLGGALDNLSGEELARFKIALIDTFNAGESHALKLAGVVEGVTAAAFRRLGISMQEISTGIDETGAEVLAAFNVIASDANATSEQIAAAFKAAAGRLDTEEELKLLREAFAASARQAGMSAEEISRALAWLDEDIDKTAEKVKAIGDGFDTTADKAEQSAARQVKAQRDVQGEIDRTNRAMDNANQNSGGSSGDSRKDRLRKNMREVGEVLAKRQQADLERRTELLGASGAGEVVTLRFEGPNGGTELSGTKDQVDRMISMLKQQGLRTS